MKFLPIIVATFLSAVIAKPIIDNAEPGAVLAVESNSLTKRESCSVKGKGGLIGDGTCRNTSFGNCPYVSVPGFCSGPSDFQCCRTISCTGKYSAYTCRNTYKGCGSGSKFVTGYCPGDETIKCCVPS